MYDFVYFVLLEGFVTKREFDSVNRKREDNLKIFRDVNKIVEGLIRVWIIMFP